MPSEQYFREKLSYIIHNLVIGEGNIKERLLSSKRYFYLLKSTKGLPDYLKDDWQFVIDNLTKYGPVMVEDTVMQDPILHTLRRIRKKTASKIAERIYKVYSFLG